MEVAEGGKDAVDVEGGGEGEEGEDAASGVGGAEAGKEGVDLGAATRNLKKTRWRRMSKELCPTAAGSPTSNNNCKTIAAAAVMSIATISFLLLLTSPS